MKKLIIFLTAVATFFTVTNVLATVEVFSQTTSLNDQVALSEDAGVIKGCFLSSRNISSVDIDNCKGTIIEYSSKETFIFMGEIYPNEPEHLFSNRTGEGFLFMDEYYEPIPASDEEILPPNVHEQTLN